MAILGTKTAHHNATVGNPDHTRISVTRSKSALKRALSAAGRFALVAGIGCAVGGFTLWHSVDQTASTFSRKGRAQTITDAEAIAYIQAWKLDVLTHGGLALINGVIASTIAGWALLNTGTDEDQDPALIDALVDQRLTALVGASDNPDVLNAVGVIKAEISA